MTDDYKIIFQIDSNCEKEFGKNRVDSDEEINKIIKYSVMHFENGIESHIQKLNSEIQEKLYFETTLYIVKLGRKERALITIDVDELFDQLIITLWAYTSSHDYEKVFRRLSESMYQKYLNQEVNE